MKNYQFKKDIDLVSISNSILYYFTNESYHQPNQLLLDILQKSQKKKVVLMLFDGLGKSIQELHLNPKDFLMRKKVFEANSVFPPTTVACTSAICSGKYPVETGWLGWKQYFKNHQVIVDMFTNRNSLTEQIIKGPHLSRLYCAYEPIWETISSHGVKAGYLYPKQIDPLGAESLDEFFLMADQLMKKKEDHFYYMYWTDPDALIHDYGTTAPQVKTNIKTINKKLAALAKQNPDNLIIVLADHSLVDTTFLNIYEHEDFAQCLKSIFSIDCRSSFFHLKEGYEKQFIEAYNKYYKDFFAIKSKQEVIDEHMFGYGEPHVLFEDFLGDYLLTSISQYGFKCKEDYQMIGAHSGSLEEEFVINVAVINS